MTSEAKDISSKAFKILRKEEEFDLEHFAYRNEAAIAAFKEALSIDPLLVEAWIGLGIAYAYCPNNFEDARSAFMRAQQIDPANAATYYQLGRLYFSHAETNYETATAEEYEKALHYLKEASVQGYHDLGDLYNLMGTVAFRLKRYDAAIAFFQQSVAEANEGAWLPSTYFLAAEANKLNGNLREALRWYESYLSKGYDDEQVRLKIRNLRAILQNRLKAL